MLLPAWLARFNRVVTNRLTRPFARRFPGFAVVRHVGRRTGRPYRTPVNMFRSADLYLIALTYGADRDWVKNVLAAGGCTVETRGMAIPLTDPRVVLADYGLVPSAVRPILKVLGVTGFMELSLDRRER
ncbi:MAG: nitroreductase family deazaflavin-dependent oxidoreductase [Actinomycetota bacterium]